MEAFATRLCGTIVPKTAKSAARPSATIAAARIRARPLSPRLSTAAATSPSGRVSASAPTTGPASVEPVPRRPAASAIQANTSELSMPDIATAAK